MAFLLKYPQISVQVGQKHILSLISINVQQIQKTLRISLQKENYYSKNNNDNKTYRKFRSMAYFTPHPKLT